MGPFYRPAAVRPPIMACGLGPGYHPGMSDARVRRDSGLPFQEIQGRTVVLSPARREVHELDEVGTFLWTRLDRPRTAADLVDSLCGEFEVEPGRAREDVRAFLTELRDKGLVVDA